MAANTQYAAPPSAPMMHSTASVATSPRHGRLGAGGATGVDASAAMPVAGRVGDQSEGGGNCGWAAVAYSADDATGGVSSPAANGGARGGAGAMGSAVLVCAVGAGVPTGRPQLPQNTASAARARPQLAQTSALPVRPSFSVPMRLPLSPAHPHIRRPGFSYPARRPRDSTTSI